MFEINPYNILAAIIFGTIGFGAFRFGRSLERTKPIVIGVLLMGYPYFFKNPWLLWGIGTVLIITLCFHHDS